MTETKPSTTTTFKMGDPVPEWLIAVEPMSPQAYKGNFRFALDVDVIETDEIFAVVPRMFGDISGGILDASGTVGCKMMAASKYVRVVNVTTDFFPEGMGRLVPMGAVQPPPAAPVEPIPVPDPHRTFWQRLRYAFLGR